MPNDLGQPTIREIQDKFCTEMLCNALLCAGCPIYATEKAAAELAAKDKALEILVMFLTNANTITAEAQAELIKRLAAAGRQDLADAVVVGGFTAAPEVSHA